MSMPIYHFIVNYTKESHKYAKKTKKSGDDSSSVSSQKSTVIILAKDYEEARQKLHNHLSKRPRFTGKLSDYDIHIDWIDKLHDSDGILN